MNVDTLLKNLYCFLYIYYQRETSPEVDEILFSQDSQALAVEMPSVKKAVQSLAKGNLDAFDDALMDIGERLKGMTTKFSRNADVAATQLKAIKAFTSWLRTGSETAFNILDKYAVNMRMPWLGQFFAKDLGSQDVPRKALQKLVYNYTGEHRDSFTLEEAKKLSEEEPDIFKAYQKLRREYNQVWRDALSTFVRNSGKTLVDTEDALRFMKDNGIQHNWPSGFIGKVDSEGEWYTSDGDKINGKPAGPMFPSVEMNDTGEGDWIFVAIRADGTRGNYFYTSKKKIEKTKIKFAAVRELIDSIDGMRAKWKPFIKKFDETDPKSVGALVLEMSFLFSSRIGSPTNENTQGMSSIRLKNVWPQPDGSIKIRYKGKKGVQTQHWLKPDSVNNRVLLKAIDELMEGKQPRDFLFTTLLKNGSRKVLQPSKVRELFYQFGAPADTTVHKLRTLRATVLMEEMLRDLYKTKNSYTKPELFNRDLMKMATEVGKVLNHKRTTKDGGTEATGTTALQNYIDPSLLVEAYQHYQIAIPLWLEKILSRDAE